MCRRHPAPDCSRGFSCTCPRHFNARRRGFGCTCAVGTQHLTAVGGSAAHVPPAPETLMHFVGVWLHMCRRHPAPDYSRGVRLHMCRRHPAPDYSRGFGCTCAAGTPAPECSRGVHVLFVSGVMIVMVCFGHCCRSFERKGHHQRKLKDKRKKRCEWLSRNDIVPHFVHDVTWAERIGASANRRDANPDPL
jgi:hypothetical protein